MSWFLLVAIASALVVSLSVAVTRRIELARMERTIAARQRAEERGEAHAELQHPVIDLSRCLGCGTCVEVCPEQGVLELVHGQAAVVNGARCRGISACERECPVGAISITLGDLSARDDVPAITDELEAIGTPGLFLAGEVTAQALIARAVEHGTRVAAEVARRIARTPAGEDGELDLLIVGAGPAGLAAALEATRHRLSFALLEQEPELGGTVARYPRKKLVMTQPLELPLVGRSRKTTYTKEELVEMWQLLARKHELPIRCGETLVSLEHRERGGFVARTQEHRYEARHVCLALGRRGSPRKLGVPGEDRAKVMYGLLDANAHQGRRVLVVGGGDGAVEVALGLAEQRSNRVTLSYRRDELFRVRERNAARLERARAAGTVELLLGSEVRAIEEGAVELDVQGGDGAQPLRLDNDLVFVMAGGEPPKHLLARAGVSFEHEPDPDANTPIERGTGLVPALALGSLLTLGALGFALWHSDYYLLPGVERATVEKHAFLRPSRGLGLWLGIAACGLIALNLAYLLRRNRRLAFGSLRAWMTSHVATGILAFLCATLHAGMSASDTAGGRAWQALAVLLVTGAIGRYLYAWVPRAANGQELELAQVKAELKSVPAGGSDEERRFRERAHALVARLATERQWRSSLVGRARALFGVERELGRVLRRLASDGRRAGLDAREVRGTLALARRAHKSALMAAHYEDLRALLSSWRWVHRWVALLMVLLVALHVLFALAYRATPGGGS